MDEKILSDSMWCDVETRTDNLTEEQFREIRLSGLGGSDSGGIMRLSQYSSPMTIAAEKLGLTKGFEGNAATKRGKRLEPAIRAFFAQWYEEETATPIQVFASPFLYRSKKWRWMIANIDGLIMHPLHGLCGMEIKTGNERQGEHWEGDSVPDSYYAQAQHYMAVLGLNMFIFAAFVGLDLVIRHVARNDTFIADMIEQERVFWTEYVEKKLLPPPTGLDGEDDVLAAMYTKPTKDSLDLSNMVEKAARHVELAEAIKKMEAERKALSTEFKTALGNASVGIMPGFKATWSRFKQKRFDKSKLEADCPEIVAKYTEEEDASRFTVSAIAVKAS